VYRFEVFDLAVTDSQSPNCKESAKPGPDQVSLRRGLGQNPGQTSTPVYRLWQSVASSDSPSVRTTMTPQSIRESHDSRIRQWRVGFISKTSWSRGAGSRSPYGRDASTI